MFPKGSDAPDPISSDIQHSHLALKEVSEARELASSLLKWYFHGSGDDIPFHNFATFCADYVSDLSSRRRRDFVEADSQSSQPTFVLLFFHIWASIFQVGSRPPKKGISEIPASMSISIANSLSLLNAAKLSSHDATNGRYFAKQLQLNLDMRAATLVLEDVDSSRQTGSALQQVLATGSHFHVIRLQNQDMLRALFVSPQDHKMEIWRARDGGSYGYTWRYSYVDLLPEIVTMDAGSMSVQQGDHDGDVVLLAQTVERTGGVIPIVRLDMASRTMAVSTSKLEWTSLRCYRMPGTACRVEKSHSVVGMR